MTVWFTLGVPVTLLLLVLLVGFVGSYHDVTVGTFDTTITGLSGLVSYWTLGDTIGSTTAVDSQGQDAGHPNGSNPGTYTTLPAAVPYNGGLKSAAVAGTVSLGVAELTSNGGDTSVDFGGGFVEVPFNTSLNPPQFSIVAGVSPDWPGNGAVPPSNQPAFRAVVECGDSEGTGTGFVLWSNAADQWEVGIGNGGASRVLVTGPHVTQNLAVNFLVATLDGTTLSLFVDGIVAGTTSVAGYQPATTSDLRIGSGSDKQGGAPPPKARFPFQGRIGSVAVFDRPLTTAEVVTLATAFLTSP